jgi:hypothetical protein
VLKRYAFLRPPAPDDGCALGGREETVDGSSDDFRWEAERCRKGGRRMPHRS